MKREDIEKLLGGYATGTLSDAERRLLFQAALEDQSLFDAIAGETALKELLDDPQTRANLLNELSEKREGIVNRWPGWRWAAAGSVAAVLMVSVVLLRAPAPKTPAGRDIAVSQPMVARESPAYQVTTLPPAKQKSAEAKTGAVAPGSAISAGLPSAQPGGALHSAGAVSRPVSATPPLLSSAPPAADQERPATPGSSPAPVATAVSTPPKEPVTVVTTVEPGLAGYPMPAGSQPGARQLFYSTPEVAAARVERREAEPRAKLADVATGIAPGIRYTLLERGPEGTFSEVDPLTVFHSGDAVRLSVETNAPGYLAVWNGKSALANLPVLARTKYIIPPEGAIDLYGPSGDRTLLVAFSRRAENKPAALTGAVLVERSNERATYVAEPRPVSRVSFEIRLTYR